MFTEDHREHSTTAKNLKSITKEHAIKFHLCINAKLFRVHEHLCSPIKTLTEIWGEAKLVLFRKTFAVCLFLTI
jgi:hypothetical protein